MEIAMFRTFASIGCFCLVCVTVACSDTPPASTAKTAAKDAGTTDSWVKLGDTKVGDVAADVTLAELPGLDIVTVCKANDDCIGKVAGLQTCQVAACEKATGKCIATMASDGTACVGETTPCAAAPMTCQAGACTGKAVLCDDGETCTDDSCDAAKGCQHVHNSALCDDGDPCTKDDSCSGGKCHGGSNTCTGKESNCGNVVDDDKDGATDCDDNDCAANDVCKIPGSEAICDDKLDNDKDGNTDCDDTDCGKDAKCSVLVPPTETNCSDKIDNDKDGPVDCADNDCSADAACPTPLKETACADGADDDKDGKTDCADSDCTADAVCKKTLTETVCNDKIDNDQDGTTDCSDNDCMAELACGATPETNCADKIDEDKDGKTDCADTDCAKASACKPIEVLCGDKLDNDKDGFTDCNDGDCAADAGCATKCAHDPCATGAKLAASCDPCVTALCKKDGLCCSSKWDDLCVEEVAQYCGKQCPVPVEKACADKLDEDKDGMTDCADADCAAAAACQTSLCVADYGLSCGGQDNFNNGGKGSTNQIDGYECADGKTNGETGNEYTYDFVSECDGQLTLTLLKQGPSIGFLDLYILDGTKSCASASCVGHGLMSGNTASKTLDAKKGQKFFVVVDGYQGFAGDYTLKATCGCAAGKETACADKIDNDVDGKTDCDDKDCAANLACAPTTETSCTDKLDNDKDGATDCVDTDCAKDAACSTSVEKLCKDKLDNDKDGATDCADADCAQDLACAPTVETDCGDAVDNDKDGKTDCADIECAGKGACVCAATESLACGGSSSWNSAGKGSTKAVDAYKCADLPGITLQNETGAEYAYSYAADCDGTLTVSLTKTSTATGYLDLFILDGAQACGGNACLVHTMMSAGKATKQMPVKKGQLLTFVVDGYQGFSGNYSIKAACDCALPTPATETNCTDKIDEDKDGKTDCADTDCAAATACKPGVETVCDDKIDNDKNGKTDCDDAACGSSPACTCHMDFPMTCGGSDTYNNSSFGSTKVISEYACADGTAVNETGSEYVYDYIGECDGQVTVTLTKTASTTGFLDLFILDGAKTCGGAACLSHGLSGGKTTMVSFTAKKGAKYGIAVDGYAGYEGSFAIKTACACAPASETNCTNALDDDKDGLADCKDSDCAGDAACQTAANCMPDTPLDCGYYSDYSTAKPDATNAITSYTCKDDSLGPITGETGHEEAYNFVPTCTGTATVTLTQPAGAGGQLDLFVLDGNKSCGGSTCVAHALSLGTGKAVKTFPVTKGQKFHLVVDGYSKYSGSYEIDASCSCQ